MKDGTKRKQIYPLGDVLCRKDSGTVLKNLTESVNKVEESSVKFVVDDKSKKWKCFSCNDEFLHLNCVVKPTAFLNGDLAFLATSILGKEGFSPAWCCWCDLIKAQWQKDGHEKNTKMKSVKEDPYFKIPVERIIYLCGNKFNGVVG